MKELEVKEPEVQNKKKIKGSGDQKRKEIRKSNPIVILGGKVDIWMAVTSGAGVLVK